jgi:hypothetical protein
MGFFLTKIHPHRNPIIKKFEVRVVEPNALCCVHKPQEMWNGKKRGLRGQLELNVELLEARDIDSLNKRFQVNASSLELKPAKVRICDVCHP